MAGRFAKRRAARAATMSDRTALRDSLRTWWSDRAEARKKAAEKARKKAKPGSRGVDRVPAHLRGLGRSLPEYVVEHTDSPRSDRRRARLNTGRRMASSTNTPHVNPRRNGKSLKAGRLRKELQP